MQGCFMAKYVGFERIRIFSTTGRRKERSEQQQAFLTYVDGAVKKLEMLRNEILVHVLHRFVNLIQKEKFIGKMRL